MAKARMFGRISKVEVLDDGTRMVTGVASTPTKDNDGETFTGDCLRGAIPDYLAKRRAVREMHQPIAAGVTKEMWVDDDDVTHIVAHVVDPVSVLKLDTGVLKMFSIEGVVPPGGRDSSNSKQINKLFLREVSLVDVGANPDAMIEVVKLDGAGEESEAQVAEEVKTEVTTDTATKVAVAVVGDNVRKGMYGVSALADLLRSIGYQAQDAQWEADCEGDNSPLPAQLRAWLAQGAEILKVMTEEETAELLASLAPPAPAVALEVIALADHAAADADNIAKAGAKHSADTKAKLKAVQDALGKVEECMKAFDVDDKDDDKGTAKADVGSGEDVIAKVAGLEDSISKVSAERDTLKGEVAKLQGEAVQHQASLDEIVKNMKAKGFLVEADKSKDMVSKSEKAVEAESTEPLDVMKKLFASGPTIKPRA